MNFNYKILLISIIVLGKSNLGIAQDLSFAFSNYLGSGRSNDNGITMNFYAEKPVVFGLEYRSIDWGNQVALNVSYFSNFYENERWQVNALSTAHFGMALFQKKPLFSPGLSFVPAARWTSTGSFFIQGGIGIRYNTCPGYKEIGNYKQLEYPLVLEMGFQLY